MTKLILNGRMTNILGKFIEDEQNMDIHIDSVEKLTAFMLNSQSDDAQFILDMLRWLHDLQDTFRSIRTELQEIR